MNIPSPIKLTPEEIQTFKGLAEQSLSLQQFIAMITDEGERRASNLRTDGQAIWTKMAEKYGIDIKNIMWDTTEDGYIKPVTVRLPNEG